VFKGTYSHNLPQIEHPHLAAVDIGARPFWIEHCEAAEWSERRNGNEAE
jgi:hypothetical protein